MKQIIALFILFLLLIGAYVPLTQIRDSRPGEARLGFFPPAPVIKALSADQYQFLSQVISLQCLFYFGSLEQIERQHEPEWNRLHEALYTATRLDPYNMDAYYFTQAVLTWDAGKVRAAVQLLEYGFAHRTWDWYFPFFLSFDYAFFLRDYNKAGEYVAKAAELNPRITWLTTLAARYFYEGGSTKLGLSYLRKMINESSNETIRKQMIVRAEALEGILELEAAVAIYADRFGHPPKSLVNLVKEGIIERIPEDPYGGAFYLDNQGKVRTTSKLAFRKKSGGTN